MNDFENAFIQDVKSQVSQEMQSTKQEKPKGKKALIIIIIIAVLATLLGGALIWSVFFKQSSLFCGSDKDDITLYYNHEKIVDYKSNGMELNLENQNKLFKNLGKDEYIKQFKSWYKKTSGVDCK